MDQISVYLVDDHAVVRQGYRHLLEKSGINVLAEAESGEDAYQHAESVNADVIVMDLSMPGMGGLETIKRIKSRNNNVKILVFSMHDDAIFLSKALQAGALGYVTKASAPDVLVEAVKSVSNSKTYVSQDIAHHQVTETITNLALDQLSPREFEVFRMLAEGLSIDAIAKALFLDYKTIANTQTRLKQKLNVENSAQITLAAIKYNLIKK